ncbi:MAG: hypothetical protein RBQ77_05055 [Candidatus Methanomethylophilaceae archaeon]|jgi:hypothetical protein|nr:hypothetical protein [Candidatus Methanomethylophilaceae archaeon]
MTLLGIPDPWIWIAYLASFATVIFCCVYGWRKGNVEDETDE